MSKKLYALTDEQVETLIGSVDNWSRTLRMNNRESIQEDHAIAALTPLDTDDAVERMARALAESLYGGDFWDDYTDDGITLAVTRAGFRSDARAALDALLGGGQA